MRYFSFFWFLAIGIFHATLSWILFMYLSLAAGFSTLNGPTTEASCYRVLLKVWSPFLYQEDLGRRADFPLVIAWSVGVAFLSGYLAAAWKRWRERKKPSPIETPQARRRKTVIACALLLLEAAWAGWYFSDVRKIDRSLTLRERVHLYPFTRALDHASAWQVYPGLPSEKFDDEQLVNTIRARQPIVIASQTSRAEPIPLTAADDSLLRQLINTMGTYQSYGGGKLCGGFHPDYVFVWKSGPMTCTLFLCLGCAEALFYNEQNALMIELTWEARQQFVKLLASYKGSAQNFIQPAQDGISIIEHEAR